MEIFIIIVLCIGFYFAGSFDRSRKPEQQNPIGIAQDHINNVTEEVGKLKEQLTNLEKDKNYWEAEARENLSNFEKEQERNKLVVSQKTSLVVRTGAMVENIVPLLTQLPYNTKDLHHLGMPIDYLYFSYDENDPFITFVEVKSGNAKEGKRQRLIKDIIKKGLVRYELLQINNDGVKVTRKV